MIVLLLGGLWLRRRQRRFEQVDAAAVDTTTIRAVDEELAQQLRDRD